MSLEFTFKHSSLLRKPPTPDQLDVAELALNTNAGGPFLACKDSDGNVVELGGVYISAAPPLYPLPGTSWLDTGTKNTVLKIYDGEKWLQTGGFAGAAAQLSGVSPIDVQVVNNTATITIANATETSAGAMSASDKVKLDGLAAGVKLDQLTNVNVENPQSGDALIYDATTQTWYNISINAKKAGFVEPFDGVRTTFTLTEKALSANDILLSLGGVIQEPGVAFSFFAPSTVNFVTPPPANIPYFVLIESIPTAQGEAATPELPEGTSADEYLQWQNDLKAWSPSAVIDGGTF